jgi:hypothetical protein
VKRGVKVKAAIVFVAGCLLTIATGCTDANKMTSLVEQVEKLTRENTKLQTQSKKTNSENEQLKNQVKTLSGLSSQIRLENLYNLQNVHLTSYTNLYDKNSDLKKETLIVYLQPIDEQGDIIKASGSVDVQLWNLNRDPNHALIGQWRVDPAELKKCWFSTIVTPNYRLTFDVADIIKNSIEPLTVKMTFTDYITGKVFKQEAVVKP